jgi:5-methylcytosine-specific restriction endonuclease McrA
MKINSNKIHKTYQQGLAAKDAGERGSLYHGKMCKTCKTDVRYVSTKRCRQCQCAQSSDYNSRNKEAVKKRAAVHNAKTRNGARGAWREISSYYRFNKADQLACNLSVEQRQQMRNMYDLANKMTTETGITHEVDHVIPYTKCGFHHPDNLQIITMKENRKKRDYLDTKSIEQHFKMPVEDIASTYYPENEFMGAALHAMLTMQKETDEIKELLKEFK